jgi:membrane-associated phospholipid phosphatase
MMRSLAGIKLPCRLNRRKAMMNTNQLDRSALWISHLFCPPAVAGIGMLLVTTTLPTPPPWGCAAAYLLLAIGVPLLVLFRMLHCGSVSDLDVTQRHERIIPCIIALGGASFACGCLYYLEAPQLIFRFAVAHATVITLVCFITRYWKISVHSAGIAGVATFFSSVMGLPLIAFAPILLVGWSRIRLGHHTIGQVFAGAIIGSLIFILLLPTF